MNRRHWLGIAGVALACAAGSLVGGPSATAHDSRTAVDKSPLNSFQVVATNHVFTGSTAMFAADKTYVAWATHTGLTFGASYVSMNRTTGTPSAAAAALSGLSTINSHLNLLPEGVFPNDTTPLLVYTGTGCVIGALGPTVPWTPQTWSLSNDCVNPVPAAAEADDGTLAASWPGSPGLRYRVGISGTIPATGPDSTITVSGTPVYQTGTAFNPVGDHADVGWSQFGGSADGYYVKDVTAGSSPLKMPGTGPNSIIGEPQTAVLGMAAGSLGVYVAACSNANPCHLLLWQVGDAKSHAVPGAKQRME